jgi:hypothetical protein
MGTNDIAFSLWPRLSSLPPHEQWRARSNEHATVFRTTWPEFAEWLAQPLTQGGKHEQAFSPLSAIQPGKGGRIAGGPASFLALEYDDSASPKALSKATDLVYQQRLASVIYTTASATPRCPRFRVVMPISASSDGAAGLDDAAYASCVDHFGQLVGVRPSPESRQRTRLWYRPIAGAQVWSTTGRPWDVAASLEAYPPPPPRVPPPAPSADALRNHWPLAERVRQAWARLLRVRPAGAFAAGCCCHDHGVPEDVARSLLWAYATMQGWVFDEADIADRLEHAYEYARDPFGCQLQPSVLTDDQLRQRIAGAVGVGR